MKKISYKVGDTLEVKTFAGPKVYKKVTSTVDRRTEWSSGDVTIVKGFEGSFERRKDLVKLKQSCVPYTGREKLKDTRSFTYDWQIIRVVKKGPANGR